MRGISDKQQNLVITTVAKIPVPQARKPFLVELEKQLPKSGRVTDAQLLEAINATLTAKPTIFIDEEGQLKSWPQLPRREPFSTVLAMTAENANRCHCRRPYS